MDNAVEIPSNEHAPLFEQVAGKGKGRVFELSIDKISLGRGEENDIIIDDDSVSREHAHIERGVDGQFVIFDNKSKNGVLVNGEKVDATPLRQGDLVQMGHFVFRFRIPQVVQEPTQPPSVASKFQVQLPSNFSMGSTSSKRPLIYGIGALAVGFALYNYSSTPEDKTSDTGPDKKAESKFSPSEVPTLQEDGRVSNVPGLQDPLSKREEELSKMDFNDMTVKESESYFRKGQRDYFNKNFHRAIDNFDSALAISKRHPLAEYYKGLAIHDAENEAEKNREIGIKYFESLQYSRAIYHLKEAVALLAHSGPDKKAAQMVSECERYINLAQRKLQAGEMFP